MKKKLYTISSMIFAAVLCLVLCFALAACNSETQLDQLISDYGITVEGGGFEKGSSLVADLIETTGEKGQEIIALLEGQNYDKDGEVSIYDIFVAKDGNEVQPNGKVKVTLPAPFESENGYVTFHVKDDNSVETLETTYAEGKISFETESFSYFVITGAPEEAQRYAIEVVMSDYLKITDKATQTEITGDSVAVVWLAEGESVTLTATSKNRDYLCIGWYKIEYSEEDGLPVYTQLSATNEFTCTMGTEPISVYPMARGKLSGLLIHFEDTELEPANMLFEGEGDMSLLYNVPVFGCAAGKWIQLKENFDYTVDLGGLDFSKAGSYTVTYQYKWEEGFEERINFMIEPRQYLFTTGVSGGAGGKISLGTLELPDDYTTEFTKGQELLLSAVADEGYHFLGWYEPVDVQAETVVLKDTPVCADAEYRYITGEVDYAVYAVFEEISTYLLTVGQQGAGGCISVNGDTASSFESSPYYENYEAGESITLVAQTRSSEYTFKGWFEIDDTILTHLVLKDTPVCTELTYAFDMLENGYTVYAVFEEAEQEITYQFNAYVSGGSGTIYYGNVEQPNGYQAELTAGTKVTLTALPSDGYRFVGWYEPDGTEVTTLVLKDTPVSISDTYEFTVPAKDYTVYAVFEEVITYSFSAFIDGDGGYFEIDGEDGGKDYYQDQLDSGDTVTLKVVANEGYTFKGWYTDTDVPELISTSAEYTFTIENKDRCVMAVFEAKVTALLLDGANAGFTEGVATYTIGDENKPNPEYVVVNGVTADGNVFLTKDIDYTIDLGGLDFETAGTYVITYTYLKNSTITATLKVVVEVHKYNFNVYLQEDSIGKGTVAFAEYYCEGGETNDAGTHCYYRTTQWDKLGVVVTLCEGYEDYEIFWYQADSAGNLSSDYDSYGSGYYPAMPAADLTVYVAIRPQIVSLRLDAANAGYTNGTATYTIGDEFVPDAENVLVYVTNALGEESFLKSDWSNRNGDTQYNYIILYNDGTNNVSLEYACSHAGTYTVYFVYKTDEIDADTGTWGFAATLTLTVVSAS